MPERQPLSEQEKGYWFSLVSPENASGRPEPASLSDEDLRKAIFHKLIQIHAEMQPILSEAIRRKISKAELSEIFGKAYALRAVVS